MPIFEYSCRTCGFRFEKLQKAGETSPVACPGCGSVEVKKELSPFSAATGAPSAAACFSGG